jgi:hypothetical protein
MTDARPVPWLLPQGCALTRRENFPVDDRVDLLEHISNRLDLLKSIRLVKKYDICSIDLSFTLGHHREIKAFLVPEATGFKFFVSLWKCPVDETRGHFIDTLR